MHIAALRPRMDLKWGFRGRSRLGIDKSTPSLSKPSYSQKHGTQTRLRSYGGLDGSPVINE